MKFREVNPKDINRGARKGKIRNLIEEFIEADIAMAEVIDYESEYKNKTTAPACISNAIKRAGYSNVVGLKVVNNIPYLVNLKKMDGESK